MNTLSADVDLLRDRLSSSRYAVAFTGAGISTLAGIQVSVEKMDSTDKVVLMQTVFFPCLLFYRIPDIIMNTPETSSIILMKSNRESSIPFLPNWKLRELSKRLLRRTSICSTRKPGLIMSLNCMEHRPSTGVCTAGNNILSMKLQVW